MTSPARCSVLALACVLSASVSLAAAASAPQDWASAVAAVESAAASLTTRPAESRVKLLEAACVFEQCARDPHASPAGKAAALFNAGSARLLASDLPGAMLNLKRARLLDPALPGLDAALAKARASLATGDTQPKSDPQPAPTPDASPAPESKISTTAALDLTRSMLNRVPAALYLALGALALFTGSCALAAGLVVTPARRPTRLWGRRVSIISCSIGILALAALLVARWPALTSRDAVLVASGVVPKSSPGLSSPTVPALTLTPGQELRVLETASASSPPPATQDQPLSPTSTPWIRCILPESPLTTPFWINADAAELVVPGQSDQAHPARFP